MKTNHYSNTEFNQHLEEGKLMGVRCKDCESLYLPPRPMCTSCYSNEMAWVEMPLKGNLAAFTTYQQEQTTYLVLCLVFPGETDAQAAADIVAQRLRDYSSISKHTKLDDDFWRFEKATGVETNGLPVAVIVMRAAETPPTEIREGSYSVYRINWYEMVIARDVLFLLNEK